MTHSKSLMVLLAGLALGASAQASNLLTNGDFELSSGQVNAGDYTAVSQGQTTIAGWTVFSDDAGSGVDLVRSEAGGNSYGGSIDGISVDLAGSPGWGGIKQSFQAVAGVTYSLTFDRFRNDSGAKLFVDFGTVSADFAIPAAVVRGETLSWTATATGAAWVSFNSEKAPGLLFGPTVDNISVSAPVPEAGTSALMLAGLAALGFFIRRRA